MEISEVMRIRFPQQVFPVQYPGLLSQMLTYELKSVLNTSSLSKQADWYWTLQIEDAKKVAKHLKGIEIGTFWHTFYLKPIRKAIRAKQTEIEIKTSGFSTTDFYGVLCEVAGGYENLREVDKFEGFPDWVEMNFNYSGEGANHENYWLSKSDTDYKIYSETELKKQFQSLSKAG